MSSGEQRVVIVGAGMAGVGTAVALREQGWDGGITLLGAEPHVPYDRPPLSKAILLGTAEGAELDVDFAALDAELLLGRHAGALRPERRQVITDAGVVPYDRLVLASGAEPVPMAGGYVLRTLDDAMALRALLAEKRDVIVVGAGWIGAEFATAARQAGCAVTVLEAADRPLAGALPAEVGERMRGWYADAGAELRTGAPVTAVEPGGVQLADSTPLRADAVVAGVGARPATGWLADSGVALGEDGAVLADDRLRTSVPDVYAVGDCVSFPSARFGERLLVHHWDNAVQGALVAAANLLGGDERYDPVPYFWSEQFGHFVQYVGHHESADTMLWRGDPDADRAWTVCWLRAGALVALLAVDRPRDLAQARKLIASGTPLAPSAAADPATPLKSAVR